MVLDFGFLKDMMMQAIHDPMDHGIILWNLDPILSIFPGRVNYTYVGPVDKHPNSPWLKLYLLAKPPTAEVLAEHYYKLLGASVHSFTGGQATLESIRVHETPNSIATYPG